MLNNQPNWETLYRDTIYAVSHDLGAPCRHLRSFSKLLLEKNAGLDSDSKEMVEHIHRAGIETQAMLDGLLRLSRVHSQTVGLSVVSAATLAEHFKCQIEPKDTNTHVCINLKRLDMAAQELANNATQYGKFTGYRVTTRPKWLSITALVTGQVLANTIGKPHYSRFRGLMEGGLRRALGWDFRLQWLSLG